MAFRQDLHTVCKGGVVQGWGPIYRLFGPVLGRPYWLTKQIVDRSNQGVVMRNMYS